MAESKDALTEAGRQPSSAELRSEIERTRAEMDSTFDALERKMTPGQILEEAWHLTRGGTSAGASKIWQIAREHPLPATVIGLGLGWLLVESSRGDGRSSRTTRVGGRKFSGRTSLYDSSAGYGAYPDDYNTDYQESWESEGSGVSGRVSSAAGSVKDAAVHAKDSLTDAASTAGHKVADVAGTVKERASDLGHRTREKASELGGLTREKASELGYQTRNQARRAQTGFWQMMEENPLAVGVATLTLGLLGGLALPSTRKEDELLGETRDRLVDRIEEVGREALDKGKQVAGTAVDTLKEEAETAGLTASNLADKVREVGRQTKEAVKEEVKNQDLAGSLGTSGSQGSTSGSTSGSASTGGTSTGAGLTGSSLTTGGVTTPSATTGSTRGTTGGSTSGTSGASGTRGRNTPRETITPVEPETANKR
ncbi:MAG TPA: DUF3618 domain-containing protein [Thermoanaerobaculia bacterium]|nr:DUF3618 domain-containing protein [Thermoanaerobaculia bacterium]